MLFCIFRVSEKKYKDLKQIKHYEQHMEREIPVPNANMTIKNTRLIGSPNVLDDVKAYINGIKLRKNNVLARDLLLTASPDFFKNATEEQKQAWVNVNVKWLKENFGDNCLYATLHTDETTWHISALIVPKFYDEKKHRYILANARYFDGISKMSAWQDNYASAMKESFTELNRGIKFSKAKHVQIRQFYTMINKEFSEGEVAVMCARAKNSELLQMKLRSLQDTLNKYKGFIDMSDEEKQFLKNENRILYENVQDIKKDKDIYREAIKTMSELYKIPQSSVVKVLDYVQEKLDPEKNRPFENQVDQLREVSKTNKG